MVVPVAFATPPSTTRPAAGIEMDEPRLFDALRAEGVDADDPEIRTAVRLVAAHADEVEQRHDTHRSRRCMEAMHLALDFLLQHPDVEDMSSFEAAYDEDE